VSTCRMIADDSWGCGRCVVLAVFYRVFIR